MPSDKRQRQRENSLARQQAIAAAQQQAQRRRRGIIIVVAALVVGAAVFYAVQGEDPETTTAASGPPTTVAGLTRTKPECPPTDGTSRRFTKFPSPPPDCLKEGKQYSAVIRTDIGSITVELDREQAPRTVNNFVYLARHRFFDGIIFHRVIPDFMDQTGDPEGTGRGGPGYEFEDEIPEGYKYKRGDVAMANSGPNTNGSQFFIVTGPQGEALPPSYSPFGRVTKGLSVADKINKDGSAGGAPEVTHWIRSVTITEE